MSKRKFKEGDRIKIKTNSKIDGGKYADKEGVIVKAQPSHLYPYDVNFSDGDECPFHANELESIS